MNFTKLGHLQLRRFFVGAVLRWDAFGLGFGIVQTHSKCMRCPDEHKCLVLCVNVAFLVIEIGWFLS